MTCKLRNIINHLCNILSSNITLHITPTPKQGQQFIDKDGPLLFVLDEAPLQHKILNFGLFQAKTYANGL